MARAWALIAVILFASLAATVVRMAPRERHIQGGPVAFSNAAATVLTFQALQGDKLDVGVCGEGSLIGSTFALQRVASGRSDVVGHVVVEAGEGERRDNLHCVGLFLAPKVQRDAEFHVLHLAGSHADFSRCAAEVRVWPPPIPFARLWFAGFALCLVAAILSFATFRKGFLDDAYVESLHPASMSLRDAWFLLPAFGLLAAPSVGAWLSGLGLSNLTAMLTALLILITELMAVLALRHHLRRAEFSVWWIVAAALCGAVAVIASVVSVVSLPSFVPSSNEAPIARAMTSMVSRYGFAVMALPAAAAEELFFRGVLWSRVPRFPALTASVIFIGAHLPQLWGAWPSVVSLLVLVAILTAARRWTDNVWFCVTLHVTHNLGLILLSLAG